MKEQIDKAELQEFVITLSDCQHKFDKEVNKAIVTGTPLPKENQFYARYLMEQGYRKQEWISVYERLPEPNVECLVAAKVGNRLVVDFGKRVLRFDYCKMKHLYEWAITNDWDDGEGCEITHWMPLPEPPKMEGDTE